MVYTFALMMRHRDVPDPRKSSDRPPALEACALSHRYAGQKQNALDLVSLRLEAGGVLAVVGQNGAGKTTLFNLLSGLFHPQSGSVQIFGCDIVRTPRRALAMLGVVFQQRAVDMDLSLRQNLRYHAGLHGIGGGEAEARIAAEAERLGITDKLERRASEVSGGELRRMETARALLHRPALLLLDEPTTGLDASSRYALLRHLRELARRKVCAVCFATHLFDEVESADQTALLHRGKLLSHGRLDELLTERAAGSLRELFLALPEGEP